MQFGHAPLDLQPLILRQPGRTPSATHTYLVVRASLALSKCAQLREALLVEHLKALHEEAIVSRRLLFALQAERVHCARCDMGRVQVASVVYICAIGRTLGVVTRTMVEVRDKEQRRVSVTRRAATSVHFFI